MASDLKEKYKVKKDNVEEEYRYYLGLRNDPEYQKRVYIAFCNLTNLFRELYPGVTIEAPRGRKKSLRSMKIKIENLEIERLSKLYVLGDIDREDLKDLYSRISKKTNNTYNEEIKRILTKKINNLDDINKIMQDDTVSGKIKTALLRIANAKLIKIPSEENKKIQEEIDAKYGEKKVKETGLFKYDLLKWKDIEKMTYKDIAKVHNPKEYLKIRDVIGIKITIGDVPNNVNTSNMDLMELIDERAKIQEKLDMLEKESKLNGMNNDAIKRLEIQRSDYDDKCRLELAKDFAQKLMDDKEWNSKKNIRVLMEYCKHKNKQNGYKAEHLKFVCTDEPQYEDKYEFELQLRSIAREDLSRGNGSAAHTDRDDKERMLPRMSTKKEFLNDCRNYLPEYFILTRNEDGKYSSCRNCSMMENFLEFYFGYVDLPDKTLKKAEEYIKDLEKEKEKNLSL